MKYELYKYYAPDNTRSTYYKVTLDVFTSEEEARRAGEDADNAECLYLYEIFVSILYENGKNEKPTRQNIVRTSYGAKQLLAAAN